MSPIVNKLLYELNLVYLCVRSGADLGEGGGGLTWCHTSPPFLEGFQQVLEPAAEAMEYLLALNVRLKYDI